MKCPKCHYLSFEPEPRCKNCGYDLLEAAPGLSIKTVAPPEGPFADLELHPAASTKSAAVATAAGPGPELPAAASRGPWPPPAELPLFIKAVPKAEVETDEPLVKMPAAPRPPLSVRRQTPDAARLRAKYHREPNRSGSGIERSSGKGLLDLDYQQDEPARPVVSAAPQPTSRVTSIPPIEAAAPRPNAVGPVRRLEAAAIDGLFLGAINLALVWLTLQQCDLTFAQAGNLPWLPVGAFLFLLNGGYLLMFTATNGQTVGKMAAHIRVVVSEPEAIDSDRVSVRQAALRALLTIPSVLILGAGFFPALLGERLALHDRLAHTRVIRA